MHLKLSVIALASLLTIAACGDDDEPGDGGSDSSVKDGGGKPSEDSGADSDSGTGDAG